MTPVIGALIAVAVGILGTSTIHVSKGFMKMGYVADRGAARSSTATHAEAESTGGRKAAFVVGMLMNFTNPLWVIIANRFAPTVYYTSVYGVGVISLLVFSHCVLGERITRRRFLGAAVVAVATVLIGFGQRVVADSAGGISENLPVLIFSAAWLLAAPVVAAVVRGLGTSKQEIVFGALGGGLASLDAVIKGIAQSGPAGRSFLPTEPVAWLLFALSFLGAAGAFGMIQWSYVRKCRASMMGASYSVTYVALPLLVGAGLGNSGGLSILQIVGLLGLAGGMMLVADSAPRPAMTRAVEEAEA